jgi:hypothetical protein
MAPSLSLEAFKTPLDSKCKDYFAAKFDWEYGDKTEGLIHFIADIPLWKEEKSFCLNLPLPRGQPRSNLVMKGQRILVCCTRGREAFFTLDKHGFAYAKLPPMDIDWMDKTALETQYTKQMEDFLRGHLQADFVHVFDYTVSAAMTVEPLFRY